MSSDDSSAAAALFNALIPGDAGRWPCFSAAVPVRGFVDSLGANERQAIAEAGKTLDRLSGTDLIAAVAAWERTAPRAFAAVLSSAHRAYYTSPDVLALVAALADSGPREPSRRFDSDLVAQVVATAAGRRRL